MAYNGWKNKETWLVHIWYMDSMAIYFSDMDVFYVEAEDLEETIRYIAEEREALSRLPAGLLSDFINTCWGEVDWDSLCGMLNGELEEMERDHV